VHVGWAVPLDDGGNRVLTRKTGVKSRIEVQGLGDSVGARRKIQDRGVPTGGDFVQGLLESGCVVHYPVAYGAVIGLYVSPTGERSDKLFVHPAKEGGLGARGHGIAGGGTVPDPGDLDGVIRARRLGTGRQ